MKKDLSVEFRISGLSLEKLLNAANRQGIALYKVKRKKNREMLVRCPVSDYEAFRKLGEEKGYQIGKAHPVGFLRIGKKALNRKGLLLGIAASTALLIYIMGFVWEINVENAGPYEGEVYAYLNELGIRPWMRKQEIDLASLREKLEWRLSQVKWVRTEWKGTALKVRLEEGTPSPQIESMGDPGDVVASESGILIRLTAFSGTSQAKAGDLVRKGQILIRGEERGENGEMIRVKARGEAIARTWVSVRIKMPVWEYASVPTGRKKEIREVWTPFYAWRTETEPEYPVSDREILRTDIGGAWIPLALSRESIEEILPEKKMRNLDEVKREGEKAAIFQLNQALISDETVDKWINFSMIEGDTITVTATAEVHRSIGRCRKY